MWHSKSNLVSSCVIAAISVFYLTAAASAADSACPLQEVHRYEYGCRRKGHIRAPSTLRIVKNTRTAIACGKICRKDPKCLSFRWLKGRATCQLYRKYLTEMFTDFGTYREGLLFDRDCFSSDCKLIAACNATMACEESTYPDAGFYFGTFVFDQYACNYGRTARSTNHQGAPYQVKDRKFFDADTYSACEAIQRCTWSVSYYAEGDTLDVHLHLPSNQWECVVYDNSADLRDDYKEYGYQDYFYFDCYHDPYQEDVSRKRYTVRNESVGAGYGLRWTQTYGGNHGYPYCY